MRALPLAVQVTDNDTRGVTVSETAVSFREGGRTTYTVVLDTRPSGTVRVRPALATGSDADVTVSPASLSFTASNWSRARTVTLRAGEDADLTNDSATVEHAVSGADYGENSVTADDVRVTVTDDDVPSTAINLSVAPATVREGASATRLTVTAELDAAPEAAATEVTLSLAGLTATSGTDFQAVDPVTLTLPAGRVSATARITLTPVRDAIDEGDGETVRIGAVNASSGSTLRLNPSALEVTIADDDTRGITLSRSALTVREEGSAIWTVRLKSAPEGGDVTVRPTVTGNPDVTVAPASLTFTAADWSRAQTVTVTAADDADGDNETAVVEHRVSGADYGANGVTVPDLPVSVDDNDPASRSVQLAVAPLVVEEGGGGATVAAGCRWGLGGVAAATVGALVVSWLTMTQLTLSLLGLGWRALLRRHLPALWAGAWAAPVLLLTAMLARQAELPAAAALAAEFAACAAAVGAATWHAPRFARGRFPGWGLADLPLGSMGRPGRWLRFGLTCLARRNGRR